MNRGPNLEEYHYGKEGERGRGGGNQCKYAYNINDDNNEEVSGKNLVYLVLTSRHLHALLYCRRICNPRVQH